jgi:hypothetical protein
MATLTGENLLGSVIESSDVEINTLIRSTLTARLQQIINNGTYSKLAAGIAMSGYSSAINDAMEITGLCDVVDTNAALIEAAAEGEVDLIDFPPVGNGGDPSEVTPVDIDTGTLEAPEVFDAGNEAYNLIDDASVLNNMEISNFTSDDRITISNATIEDYAIGNDGTDVKISYNYNDSGTINMITLIGVVTADDLIYDQASFEAAVGFDAFAV